MNLFLRLLVFFLSYTLDIRVRAEEVLEAAAVTEVPSKCALMSSECAISTDETTKFRLTMDRSLILVGPQSSLLRRSGTQITLLDGEFWIQARGALVILDAFGEIRTDKAEFFVHRTGNRCSVKVAQGEVVLEPKGLHGELKISEGFGNWMGPVSKKHHAQIGSNLPIPIRSFLRTWAEFFEGSRQEFKEAAEKFVAADFSASEMAATESKNFITRDIAQLKAKELQRIQTSQTSGQEKKHLRDLYWKKVFE